MKKFILLNVLVVLLISCNNYTSITKENLCGKRYTSSIPSSISQGVSYDTGTTLKCDGTFESGEVARMIGQNTVDKNYYTGTWEVVIEIPENVKYTVKKFGVDHENYSIIKYSSSNGVNDYCIYYPSSYDNSPTLAPLNVSCDPDNAGIHGGSPES